jgi:hypothetical protein
MVQIQNLDENVKKKILGCLFITPCLEGIIIGLSLRSGT